MNFICSELFLENIFFVYSSICSKDLSWLSTCNLAQKRVLSQIGPVSERYRFIIDCKIFEQQQITTYVMLKQCHNYFSKLIDVCV